MVLKVMLLDGLMFIVVSELADHLTNSYCFSQEGIGIMCFLGGRTLNSISSIQVGSSSESVFSSERGVHILSELRIGIF